MVANDAAIDAVGESAGEFARPDQPDAAEVNRLVLDHLDLVEIIASQISRSIDNCLDFDELLAAGREGLFEAARRFDPKRGASFRTFANYRIEGSIVDTVRRSLKLSRKADQQLTALEAASRVSEGDYSPGLRDTAKWHARKAPEDFIYDEVAAMATAAAMSIELHAGESATAADPEEAYARAEQAATIRAAIDELGEVEAEAIRLYFYEDKSHEVAARAMNLSKPWVHRIHTRAMITLAKRLRNAGFS